MTLGRGQPAPKRPIYCPSTTSTRNYASMNLGSFSIDEPKVFGHSMFVSHWLSVLYETCTPPKIGSVLLFPFLAF